MSLYCIYRFHALLLVTFSVWIGAARAADARFPEGAAGLTPAMLERDAQFRGTIQTQGVFRSGVYVYESRTVKDYAGAPEKLAARLALLGFTDVYLTCGHRELGAQALEWRKTFIRLAH